MRKRKTVRSKTSNFNLEQSDHDLDEILDDSFTQKKTNALDHNSFDIVKKKKSKYKDEQDDEEILSFIES